jgi:hypothetical protein
MLLLFLATVIIILCADSDMTNSDTDDYSSASDG